MLFVTRRRNAVPVEEGARIFPLIDQFAAVGDDGGAVRLPDAMLPFLEEGREFGVRLPLGDRAMPVRIGAGPLLHMPDRALRMEMCFQFIDLLPAVPTAMRRDRQVPQFAPTYSPSLPGQGRIGLTLQPCTP